MADPETKLWHLGEAVQADQQTKSPYRINTTTLEIAYVGVTPRKRDHPKTSSLRIDPT
jgi:hypothetical protein